MFYVIDPNFTVDPVKPSLNPLLSANVYSIPRTKTAKLQVMKVFQIIEKVQNEVGFDISYANRAPPIGAPNAAATPADPPAAINCLLV